MSPSNVIAICCADLHFSHRSPIARSVEEDWYAVQYGYIKQLKKLQEQYNNCPILCAGDITDRWNNPPELANFLISNLPDKIYAVPGQHDLPNHDYAQTYRSTYGTLVAAGKITNLNPGEQICVTTKKKELYVTGFPWGSEIFPADTVSDKYCIQVALIHSFIWMKGYGFPGAPQEHRVKKFLPKLKGYDVAVFGDNHKYFARGIVGRGAAIYNCGSFMRRKLDEMQYFPRVGVLYDCGLIIPQDLDVSQDNFLDVSDIEKCVEAGLDATDFLHEIGKVGKSWVDFRDAVMQFCAKNEVGSLVQKYLSQIMEGTDGCRPTT